jgi:hypothetical protein
MLSAVRRPGSLGPLRPLRHARFLSALTRGSVPPTPRSPPHAAVGRSQVLVRSFRASRPAEIGPLVAGIGIAVAVWSTRLLLQAASSPKFQEAMRDGEQEKPEEAKRASDGPSKGAPSKPASYFTTDVMGVDLGQGPKEWSSACVAVVEDGETRVVESAQGQRHTPSLVVFQDNGELVGQPALRLLFSRTDTAVHGHQLLLGMPFDSAECEEVARALPLELAPDAEGNAAVLVHAVTH